jgi:hypothetical protein
MKIKILSALFLFVGFLFVPRFVLAASLYLSPASGNYSVGQTFTVTVKTNTQSAAVNTAEAHLVYSSDTLELVAIAQGSTFYLPAPNSPSKVTGKVYFGGGLPTPGYTGTAGLLGSMTFRAKAVGAASVSISTGEVLLNDGFGTNALTNYTGASFNIAAAATQQPKPQKEPEPQPQTSPTPATHAPIPLPATQISFLQQTMAVPMYFILFFNLILLVLLALLLFMLLKRRPRQSNADSLIRQVQDDIDESLENLKQEISQKLLGLTAKSSEELFAKETTVAKELRTGIGKTRKKIDKNISKLKKRAEKIQE